MSTNKGAEQINERGGIETKVETVDYRTQAGHDKPTKENVEIIHENQDADMTGSATEGGGVLAGKAAAVTDTIKSAKDAITGSGSKDTVQHK